MTGKLERLGVERIFLYIAVFYGLLLIVIYPPFQGPDETSHYKSIQKM